MRAYLEITNICNRSCSFCPGTRRKKEFVTPEKFARRLDRLHNIEELYLHVLGEPLLHPQFAEIAALCQKKGIPVNLTTNGTLLDEQNEKILLSTPVFRQINFSLQALNAEETEYLDHILEFCRKAAELRSELYLNLRMWTLNDDYSLQTQDRRMLERIFRQLQIEMPDLTQFHEKHHSFRLTGRLYLHCCRKFEWPVNSKEDNQGRISCLGAVSQFAVLVDGTVVPCCLDSEGSIPLGNLDTQSMEEILNSSRTKAMREGFLKGTAVESFCRKCFFRKVR